MIFSYFLGQVVRSKAGENRVNFIGLSEQLNKISASIPVEEPAIGIASSRKTGLKLTGTFEPIYSYEHCDNKYMRLNKKDIPEDATLVFAVESVRMGIEANIDKGIDLVASSMKAILRHGARPLSFQSFYTCHNLDTDEVTDVIKGVSDGCSGARCDYMGNYCVQSPQANPKHYWNLIGFTMGIVERKHMLPRSLAIGFDDCVIAVPSKGHNDLLEGIISAHVLTAASSSKESITELLLSSPNIQIEAILALLAERKIKAIEYVDVFDEWEEKEYLPRYLAFHLDAHKMFVPSFLTIMAANDLVQNPCQRHFYHFGTLFYLIVDKKDASDVEYFLKAEYNARIVGFIGQRKRRNRNAWSTSLEIDDDIYAMRLLRVMPPDDTSMTPPISKLRYIHFVEVFEYLSLNQLIGFGSTCKNLQRMASFYFIESLFDLEPSYVYGGALLEDDCNMNCFIPVIKKIRFQVSEILPYAELDPFCLLRQITVAVPGNINVQNSLRTLRQIERVRIIYRNDDDCHDNYLELCPNLRHLSINGYRDPDSIMGLDNNWLQSTYPKLSHFELTPHIDDRNSEVIRFLERNPNIKHFATVDQYFIEHAFLMKQSAIKLDVLSILIRTRNEEKLLTIIYNLKEMYQSRFYKLLHLYIYNDQIDVDIFEEMVSLPTVVKMHVNSGLLAATPVMNSLTDLYVHVCDNTCNSYSNLNELNMSIANKFPNIETIEFRAASSDVILDFVRHSPKLRNITVWALSAGTHFSQNVLNLNAINEERQGLAGSKGARKVQFYVQECIYLATKWKEAVTDLKKIQMRRIESSMCEHDFFY